jgi:tetratricopeptide (TPR) repeat protein
LDLGEYLWAENFIEKYKSHLDPLHYDYAVNYCYAELHFAKKQYDKAIQNLSKINIELSQQKQQLKNLMIKIYYESGLFEETIYLIDSSKHFLSRELQLTKSTKTSYLKFINFTSSLLKAKMNAIPDKVIHLRNKIHKEKYFKNKPWLIEKISELM